MTRQKLSQLAACRKAAEYYHAKVEIVRRKQQLILDRIKTLESSGQIVKDSVKGGYGGTQTFVIEGIECKEYWRRHKQYKEVHLQLVDLENAYSDAEFDALSLEQEITDFISGIDDHQMRMIIQLRFVECLSWTEVADRVGGGNTENSVKKAFQRFMDKVEDKDVTHVTIF